MLSDPEVRRGFVVREFKAYKCFLSKQYQMPILHKFECRRAFYGKQAQPLNAYYWGDYKHACVRWIQTNMCGTSLWNDFSGKIYGKTLPDLAKKEMKRTGIYEAQKTVLSLTRSYTLPYGDSSRKSNSLLNPIFPESQKNVPGIISCL